MTINKLLADTRRQADLEILATHVATALRILRLDLGGTSLYYDAITAIKKQATKITTQPNP